ncbi:phage tail protein [Comamonas antarctica]|uniref:Phage tail protein n=1 Tax=Comamonas antarctica TaxID=2743470 RepID=A0A6N1XBK9_9BURK|nr:tail fiber protein [Comamonas antarctica]QKV55146.1 phage tail protein [Comamonas antarctica]
MADPFVAEIRMVPFNFVPRGWAACNGQLLPLSQNTALFSLLGTTYGGDGKSTFALPDLQGRAAMHPGQGPGLSPYDLGQYGGQAAVSLVEPEMPPHTHAIRAVAAPGGTVSPEGAALARAPGTASLYGPASGMTGMMSPRTVDAGGGQPHNNLQPYLTMHFIIALQGVFPPRG